MPTVEERLVHINSKVERAKKHIAELKGEVRQFLDSNPYAVMAKHDAQSRKLVYYVGRVTAAPISIALITGDVIQNLVSALDHLAYQIVCSDTGEAPPNPKGIYFPIAGDATRYEAKKGANMQGAAQATFDAIDAIKPYKEGNDALWSLQYLNNIEKHRLLLTVGANAGGVNLGQMVGSAMRRSDPEAPAELLNWLSSVDLFIRPADKGFPLNEGFELLMGGVDENPDPKQQFKFEIAFGEPGAIEGKSILKSIDEFVATVEGVISTLTPFLKGAARS